MDLPRPTELEVVKVRPSVCVLGNSPGSPDAQSGLRNADVYIFHTCVYSHVCVSLHPVLGSGRDFSFLVTMSPQWDSAGSPERGGQAVSMEGDKTQRVL